MHLVSSSSLAINSRVHAKRLLKASSCHKVGAPAAGAPVNELGFACKADRGRLGRHFAGVHFPVGHTKRCCGVTTLAAISQI